MRNVTSTLISGLLASTAFSTVAVAQDGAFVADDQIVVRGVNIPDEKRATSEISNILTPETLERTGDSDIAEALRRVTGLSLSQGKFVVVRGLNERYSNLTLNGSPLPSPEPLRRVAPLDLFPTSVVGGALVQKTFSPQYSGEFGGGLIELRSKGLPDEGFFEVSASVGLDDESTARDGLTYDGGNRDWLGYGGSIRDLPAPLQAATDANPGVAVRGDNGLFSAAEIREIGASLVNSELRVIQSDTTPVNHSFNIAGGERFDLDSGASLGFVANVGYDRSFQTKDGKSGSASLNADGTVSQGSDDFEFESTTEEVLLNGLLGFGVEFNENHQINITGLLLRKSQKEAREATGTESASFGGFDPLIVSNLEWFENQVWTGQFNSEHVFPSLSDLTVSLRGSYSEAYRDAPYETEYVYGRDSNVLDAGGVFEEFRSTIGLGSGASSSGFETRFSRVDDESLAGGLDLELPTVLFDQDVTFRAGYAYTDNERDYALRSFGFRNETGLSDADPFFFQRIDFLLADQNIGESGGFEFVEFPDQFQPAAYRGELTVHAAYASIDAQLGPYVRAAAGVRYEDSEQLVDNFNIAGIAGPVANTGAASCDALGFTAESCIAEDYFLPSASVTWNPLDDIQVRAAFSKTITRPQFQELGAAFFTDTDRDLQVFGNPFLKNTESTNYDIRAEYYFGRNQFITIGGFFKELDNPIEESLISTGNDTNATYINAPSAEIYGGEIEYEQRFEAGDILELSAFETKELVIAANYTYSQSEVSADGTVLVPSGSNVLIADERAASEFFIDGRALQGQSDHLVNFQIGLEDYEYDSKAFLLFNWTSERIRQVGLLTGGSQLPDTIERLPITIDFVYSRNFEKWGGDWEISAKVKNLLGDGYEATADGADGTFVDIDTYDLGRKMSLSLKRTF